MAVRRIPKSGDRRDRGNPIGGDARQRRSDHRAIRVSGHEDAPLVDAELVFHDVEHVEDEPNISRVELDRPARRAGPIRALGRDGHEAVGVAVCAERRVGRVELRLLEVSVKIDDQRERRGAGVRVRDVSGVVPRLQLDLLLAGCERRRPATPDRRLGRDRRYRSCGRAGRHRRRGSGCASGGDHERDRDAHSESARARHGAAGCDRPTCNAAPGTGGSADHGKSIQRSVLRHT